MHNTNVETTDFDDLVQPPLFNYGFYLPQVLLIFIICVIYSVLRDSWKVLLAGWAYFVIGSLVYKYQLLYAMDHRQRSTGRAWLIICNRIVLGLLIFQLAVAGQLVLQGAIARSAATIPLIVITLWFQHAYTQSYEPLMKFIALRSIVDRSAIIEEEEEEVVTQPVAPEDEAWSGQAEIRYTVETRPGNNVDKSEETGTRFINPSLIAP